MRRQSSTHGGVVSMISRDALGDNWMKCVRVKTKNCLQKLFHLSTVQFRLPSKSHIGKNNATSHK